MNYSPWPEPGKHWRFEWRKATWMLARPWYGANNVKYGLDELTLLSPITFWFPFLSYVHKWDGDKIAGVHVYLGWKPIPPHLDDAFYWNKLWIVREWIKQGRLFVQLSARWGTGGAR